MDYSVLVLQRGQLLGDCVCVCVCVLVLEKERICIHINVCDSCCVEAQRHMQSVVS